MDQSKSDLRGVHRRTPRRSTCRGTAAREFFIDNLLVRIHIVIEIIEVDRPCAMGVWAFSPHGGDALRRLAEGLL